MPSFMLMFMGTYASLSALALVYALVADSFMWRGADFNSWSNPVARIGFCVVVLPAAMFTIFCLSFSSLFASVFLGEVGPKMAWKEMWSECRHFWTEWWACVRGDYVTREA